MIDYDKVLFIDKHLYEQNSGAAKKRFVLSRLRSFLFSKPGFARNTRRQGAFFKSMDRPDYDQFFLQVIEAAQFSGQRVERAVKIVRLPQLRYVLSLLQSMPLLFSFSARSWKQRLFLYLCLAQYRSVAGLFMRGPGYKYIAVFADMQPLDSLICQMARQKEIPTVTFQHGLYVDYAGTKNINVINYQGHVADHFLAWGEEVAQLIGRYRAQARTTIVGKPLEPIRQRQEAGYFTLVFDQNIFHAYNKRLLAISYQVAKLMGLKVNLRLHPHNKISWYSINEELVVQDQPLDNSVFVLGHTTSMLYELMRLGIPSYKFDSDVPANTIDEQFVFSSVEELADKIKLHREARFDFASHARWYVRFIGEESLAKYAIFFADMEQNGNSSLSDMPETLGPQESI